MINDPTNKITSSLKNRVSKETLSESIYESGEMQYKLLAEHVPDVIWTMNMDFQFTYISPSVTNMRGFSHEEALHQTLAEALTPASFQVMMRVLDEELAIERKQNNNRKRSRVLNLDQKCHDGSTIHTETTITFIRDSENKAVGIVGVARDVTQRIRLDDQRKQSDLLSSLGKMTAGIAHEINNPLGSILLYSELMLQHDLPISVKKDLKVIHDEASRAARKISDLLTCSVKGSKKAKKLDIHQVLKKVLNTRLNTEAMHNINLSIRLIEGPLFVYGDSSQLSQVFMNVLFNAVETLEEASGGNIFVETSLDNDWVTVSVSDDGKGIPNEYLRQIFYPFFSTKDMGEHSGLGLSTCHGIVTSHGGLIRAEINEMGGTTIIIQLPQPTN